MNNVLKPSRPKVLVTGWEGFIGSHLVPFLRSENYDCLLWDKDIFELESYRKSVDIVIHLAAVTGPALFAQDPVLGFKVNVEGTRTVLDYCSLTGSRMIFASTCGIYPPAREKIIIDENFKTSPITDYALSKHQAEMLCQEQAGKPDGAICTVLRLFNVYGTGQNPSYVINYVVDRILGNKPVILRNPFKVRDYIYIQDVVQSFLLAVESDPASHFEVFNIGSGEGIGVLDLVHAIEKILNHSVEIQLPHDAASLEIDYVIADIAKARKLLGWNPKNNLSAGLNLLKKTMDLTRIDSTKGVES